MKRVLIHKGPDWPPVGAVLDIDGSFYELVRYTGLIQTGHSLKGESDKCWAEVVPTDEPDDYDDAYIVDVEEAQ